MPNWPQVLLKGRALQNCHPLSDRHLIDPLEHSCLTKAWTLVTAKLQQQRRKKKKLLSLQRLIVALQQEIESALYSLIALNLLFFDKRTYRGWAPKIENVKYCSASLSGCDIRGVGVGVGG